ncbi:uncharacterized protein LOC144444814 [Glandiceps talaboti]
MNTYQEKRKSWLPVDEECLSANAVQWAKASVTLERLVEDYELPQIIRVTQGWCGEDESSPDTLQGDDIVLFHEYITQSRVVAEDKYGQHITIAKDFNYKFEVFGDERIDRVGSAGPFTIPELLERYEYPVKVRLAKKNRNYIPIKQLFEYHDVRDFGDVTFTKTHTTHFLIGHCLNGRDLNSYNAIAVLPMPTEVDCEVGSIIVDGKNREWARFVNKLSRVARESFDFDDFISKNNDAYLLKAGQVPEDENEYDSIKPTFIHTGDKTPGGSVQNTKITGYDDYRKFIERSPVPKGISKPYNYLAPAHKEPPITPDKEAALRLIRGRETLYGINRVSEQEDIKPPPTVPPRRPNQQQVPKKALRPVKPVKQVKPRETVQTPKEEKTAFVFPEESDLKTLSINGVCKCLEALGFGNYADQFRKEQIDGAMLCNMNTAMFTEDLAMNAFQAMKLNKFVHEGWRPVFGE